MKQYVFQFIENAQKFGCDGFEPLDMNVFSQNNGLNITLDDQLTYSNWIAQQSHNLGLFTGIVDAVLQLPDIDSFDYVLSINCFMTNTCNNYSPVISKGKPVFDMETSLSADKFCSTANSLKFYAFTKPADFGPGATYCQ